MFRGEVLRPDILDHGVLFMARDRSVGSCMGKVEEEGHCCLAKLSGLEISILGLHIAKERYA